MPGRTKPPPAPLTAEKPAGFVGMVGCDVALDGRTDRWRDDNCPDRPGNHNCTYDRRGTGLSGRRSVVGDPRRFAEIEFVVDRLGRVGVLCCRRQPELVVVGIGSITQTRPTAVDGDRVVEMEFDCFQ